jgi:hypothetical protein
MRESPVIHYFSTEDFSMPSHRITFSLRLFIACLLGSFLVACGASSPEDAARDFYQAVADNRVDDALAFYSLEGVKENDLTAIRPN